MTSKSATWARSWNRSHRTASRSNSSTARVALAAFTLTFADVLVFNHERTKVA